MTNGLRVLAGLLQLVASSAAIGLGGDFTLDRADGGRYALHESHAEAVVLLFGYTSCPDVCPTGLSRIARALRDLGDDASRVDALFVTLDPTRDTPARLREYTRYFHPAIIGLTGDTDRLDRVARLFNVRYAFVGKDTSEHYSMDHTANVYLVDPRGSVSAILPYGLPAVALTDALRAAIAAGRAAPAAGPGHPALDTTRDQGQPSDRSPVH